MQEPSLIAALQASAFTEGFSTGDVQQLAGVARWRHCPAGRVVFREGDLHPFFYLVHSGNIALDMCLPARGCQRLLTLGPGSVVAWSAILGQGRMTATAIAVDESELIEFSGADLQRLCDADAKFGYVFMQRLGHSLSQRLVATRLQMLDLFHLETEGAHDG